MAKIKKAQLGGCLSTTGSGTRTRIYKSAAGEGGSRSDRRAARQFARAERKMDRAAAKLEREERKIPKQRSGGSTPAWQRKEGKDPKGGLNAKGVASYRRANPGSKLKTAVTTKPSKLKPGSKAANRRKSFCARMSGMKKRLTSAKTANDPNSRINKSLRKWNC